MDASGLSSRAVIGRYFAALEAAPLWWVDPLCFMFDSNMPTESYKWVGQSPAMRQWLGGRGADGLPVQGVNIPNVLYEGSVEFDGEDWRMDKTGQLLRRVGDLGRRTQIHWGSLISTLINNGPSTACYDGLNYFATNHKDPGGKYTTTQSNKVTISLSSLPVAAAALGTTTAPGILAMQNLILQGVQTILGFLDDRGEPMNEDAMEFQVQVPINMWMAAQGAVTLPSVDYGQSNLIPNLINKSFRIVPFANPRLTATDRFFIFRTDGSVKPFIRQDSYAPQLAFLDETSEYYATNHKLLFGANVYRGTGYGYWQQACEVIIAS